MTNADVPSIALGGIMENPNNPFTGNRINMENKKNPQYIATGRLRDKSETQIDLNPNKDYYVHENIFDAKNWIPANKNENSK
jgi:hypothetical protein